MIADALHADLTRAVTISLFTWRRANPDDDLPGDLRMGWWGDSFPSVPNDRIGSRLWLLSRAKLTAETVTRAREYAEEALRWLVEDGIAARVEPQIVAARLAKLLMNVVINPLAAIFRVPNGAVLELPQRPLFDALLAEAWPVLRAEGLALDEAAARERVIAVARATGANRASMLQDVLAGRRTEIDAITGAFLVMADAQGAPAPTHRAVLRLVKLLEGA